MRNYLRLIIRNFVDVLRRSRSAALLNIAGLSVAFAVFTVILIRVSQEYSYNTCFRNATGYIVWSFGTKDMMPGYRYRWRE